MADPFGRLREAKEVSCNLCKAVFPGSDIEAHDATPEHQRRKGSFLIGRAVRKVDPWQCPGPVGMMRGNAALDR